MSPRRTRALMVAAFIGVVLVLVYKRHDAGLQAGEFYSRTASGLGHTQNAGQAPLEPAKGMGSLGSMRIDHDGDGTIDKDDEETALQIAERLREAEEKAKSLANSKSPHRPDDPAKLVGVGNAAGSGPAPAHDQDVVRDVDATSASQAGAGDKLKEKDRLKEDQEVDDELDSILRRAPVIIFSKSYCPHSQKAKNILLNKYDIDPRPHVVELDRHPLGQGIQDRLRDTTGRGTVPNVMVNGKSIGGGSEVEGLHASNKLIAEVESLGSIGRGKSSRVTVVHAAKG